MTWIETTDRFVGFFDIMGFKDLVHRKSHQEVLDIMERLHDIVNIIDSQADEVLNKNPNAVFKAPIKPVIFSDSILLISNKGEKIDFEEMLFATVWVLRNCFEIGLPVKGAVSFGKFTADFKKSIYFGQPLIDAHLLQDELLIYGTVFDHTIEDFIAKKDIDIRALTDMIKYKVPLKSGKATHYISNWIYLYNSLKDKENAENSLNDTMKLYHSVSGKPRIYVDNTVDYVNHLIENRIKKQSKKL